MKSHHVLSKHHRTQSRMMMSFVFTLLYSVLNFNQRMGTYSEIWQIQANSAAKDTMHMILLPGIFM